MLKTRSPVIIFLFLTAWVHADDRLDGKYQFRFSLDHPEEKNGDFMVSVSGKDEIKVYLNGIRIHIDGISDPDLKTKKPHSP
jgi:hypothetical protein